MAYGLDLTRLGLAEHAYPTPTRGHLSGQQRERGKACPVANGRVTVATPVKLYRIMPNGDRRAYTVGKPAPTRAEVILSEQNEHKRRMAAIRDGNYVEPDHWAHKS